MGYVIIWIMAQRILIKQRGQLVQMQRIRIPDTILAEAAEKYAEGSVITVSASHRLDSSHDINNALRGGQLQFEVRQKPDFDTGIPVVVSRRQNNTARTPESSDIGDCNEFSVEVRIEQTISMQRDPEAIFPGDYRRPRVMWDSLATR